MHDRTVKYALANICQDLLLLSSLTLSGEIFHYDWTFVKKRRKDATVMAQSTENGGCAENSSKTLEHLNYTCAF